MLKKYYNLGKHKLFKLNRSLTGKGTLKTLHYIKREFSELKIKSFKCGSKVFDWRVPPEWNVNEAYVLDNQNKKIIDFTENNLHLVGYSVPQNKKINKKQLLKNIFSLPKQPDAIPYITSYYKRRWGFCITDNLKKKIEQKYKSKDLFRVRINSNFNKLGKMNYGELIIKGSSKKEILISTYVCHPSMANNELSGPIVSMGLINFFRKKKLKKTLRFLFLPETIGSIAYLKNNFNYLKKNIIGGFNLSCIGDEKQHSCILSKYLDSPSDYALIKAYKKLKIKKYKTYSFLKRGSDERQYNSPFINLGITSVFRSKYGTYPEYHTSKDDFKLVTLKGIEGGYRVVKESINFLLNDIFPLSKIICEPNLGKRNLYPLLSIKNNKDAIKSRAILDFLQYSDGKNSLDKISNIIKLDKAKTIKIYNLLKLNKLIH